MKFRYRWLGFIYSSVIFSLCIASDGLSISNSSINKKYALWEIIKNSDLSDLHSALPTAETKYFVDKALGELIKSQSELFNSYPVLLTIMTSILSKQYKCPIVICSEDTTQINGSKDYLIENIGLRFIEQAAANAEKYPTGYHRIIFDKNNPTKFYVAFLKQ